ncbi:MBL fold metallo-hydrolase [Actinomadura livida]|uniref:Glyoxylase-like metal-dependent hydrolase (Beta-lactamase superfamily II) n=1 Tax=Actinomadura livida TaxID=79909 RepID=A0A7W7IDP1_9ACTN|nr:MULTISPECIES: MBL fold metallo-hydrolase [Actinomadura]MBB4774813.1 glyoxylase-like metal-dependent hydrolase (beta-lactamase superfamily II) [Actinomadura catellatispora]GGU05839.1 hypothetical protein GCM10010208_32590 [Actinomadura livida]
MGRHEWARTGVEEVAPGVHRIPLRMPGDVLAATNVYAIVGADEIGLVDGGWFAEPAWRDLEAGLAALGAGTGDVGAVAVTHAHPDHYTLAVELRRRTGCTTYLGAGERATVEAIGGGGRGLALDRVRAGRRPPPSAGRSTAETPGPARR